MPRTLTVATVALAGLLVLLTETTGLGLTGWLAAITFCVAGWAVLAEAMGRYDVRRFGPADLVTIGRAVLVGGVVALVANTEPSPAWPLALVAGVALALDAVDGKVARKTGTASEFGARFDMEVDAFLILVLSAHVATQIGWWVLAIGAMRYLFVAVGRFVPWLRAPLPPRTSSKAVAAAQGIVLTIAIVTPPVVAISIVGLALAALVWSFSYDVRWLFVRRADVAVEEVVREGQTSIRRRIVSTLACLLLLFALLAPNSLAELTPATFLRIPVEGLVIAGLVLVLPAKPRRIAAAFVGVLLGLLTILKMIDVGFEETLNRPFHPVYDWSFFGPGIGFLRDSVGQFGTIAAVIAAGLVAVGLIALMTLSALRLTKVAVGKRSTATRVVAALGVIWVSFAVLGQPVAANSTASSVYDDLQQVRADLLDPEVFADQARVDAYRHTPSDELLTGLHGKDVVVTFVESYGRIAVQGSDIAPGVDKVLDEGTKKLKDAGFEARSAFMTSSTFGGGSWLAHATLQSGLWVDSQPRYDSLVASNRFTLTGAFRKAGWRTVGAAPSIVEAWPEGRFFGYQKEYNAHNMGYKGPNFAYAKVPDQYTMAAFERNERAGDKPVMAEIDLVSSHIPWTHLPRVVDWNDIGDGTIYRPMPAEGKTKAEVWPDPVKIRAAYGESIQYSLNTLISYVTTYGDNNLVLVFLGDHQPGPVVTGATNDHDVPITIVAKDKSVLDQISSWGWQPGLNPGPNAPQWRMDEFRDEMLSTFSGGEARR